MIAVLVAFLSNPVQAATSYSVGRDNYWDIYYAADAAVNEYQLGITTDRLVAMMLAPVYMEIVAYSDARSVSSFQQPSPMAVGRADNRSTRFYVNNDPDNTDYRRAFWSTGIGFWQLDSAGIGADFSFHERLDTSISASHVAVIIATRYKSYVGDEFEKRRYAWSHWHACDADKSTLFNDGLYCDYVWRDLIVNEATLQLTDKPTRLGGASYQQCARDVDPSMTFTCMMWNVSLVQTEGATGVWTGSLDGATGQNIPTPLPRTLITYRTGSGSTGTEYRYWLREYAFYDRDWRATRPIGSDAASTVGWSNYGDVCVDGWCN